MSRALWSTLALVSPFVAGLACGSGSDAWAVVVPALFGCFSLVVYTLMVREDTVYHMEDEIHRELGKLYTPVNDCKKHQKP